MTILSATLAAIAWACEEETGLPCGVRFELCAAEVAELVTLKSLGLNFVGVAQALTDTVQPMLLASGEDPTSFWAAYGVLPHQAARCAAGIAKSRVASSFWDGWQAARSLAACNHDTLAYDLHAELSRRGR